MITAFQIGAFQFSGFQEAGAGAGGWRPQGWRLRAAIEVFAQRQRKAREEAEAAAAAEAAQRAIDAIEISHEEIGETVLQAAALPRTLLKLRPALLDIDAELEEFGALMKMVAEIEDFA